MTGVVEEQEPGSWRGALGAPILVALALLATTTAAQDEAGTTDVDDAGVLRPTTWLALPAVDGGGRRPFRPDRVFRDHLLDRDAAPPVEGAEVIGENDAGTWTRIDAEAPGKLAVPFRLGWATTTLDAPADGFYLARFSGISRFFLDGTAHFGDRYGYGFGGVPVHLAAGEHRIFVHGLRGRGDVRFEPRPEGLVPATWDAVVGDLVQGDEAGRLRLELPVLNLSRAASSARTATVRVLLPEVPANADLLPEGADPELLPPSHAAVPLDLEVDLAPIPPLASAALSLDVALEDLPRKRRRHLEALGTSTLEVGLFLDGIGSDPEDGVLRLRIVDERAHRRVLFPSAIDGSLQEYGLVPPTGAETDAPLGLVLSCHGASVPAMGQARAYAPKDDFAIVAAHNRRPYGFDWQDWGRTDAYEALAHGLALTGIDEQRVFVTGHSMGGHGTWHLAANDPDRFLAAAPSAGWASFDTYGGRPDGELAHLWQRADGSSLTFELIENLAPQHLFVLHGTADDNVPATEAEGMLTALAEVQGPGDPEPRVHMEEGAGHWWGNRCVDWPGIFELFRERSASFGAEERRPEPHELVFRTTDPAVDSKHHWVEVLQARTPGEAVTVQGWWDEEARILTADAPDAAALRLAAPDRGRPIEWRVGDATFAGAASKRYLWVVRDERGQWVEGRPERGHKSPALPGNFKQAFGRDFVLVYGTAGDDELDAELYERARYDLENWSYRAGGEPLLLSDVEYLERFATHEDALGALDLEVDDPDFAHLLTARSPILYGSRDSNLAWSGALGDESPVDVADGSVTFGGTTLEGDDLVALFLRPHAVTGQPVGAVGVTGARAARLSVQVPYFVSGVGLPDWTVFDSSLLGAEDEAGDPVGGGDGGVLAAGWFANDWSFARPAIER